MQLQYQYHLVTSDALLDTDVRDLQVVWTSSGTFLYAATGQGGGLTAYRLDAGGGGAQLVDTAYFAGAISGTGIGDLASVSINGVEQLVVGGIDGGGLAGFRAYQNGEIGGSIVTNIGSSAGEPTGLAVSGDGNAHAIFTVDEGGGLLRSYTVETDGSFTQRLPAQADRPDFVMQGETILETAQVGDRHFVLAADSATDSISSFRITNINTGALDFRDETGASDGLGIDTPSVMQTVQAYGATFVLTGGAGSDSISVMRLNYDGSLTATEHVLDSLSTRFADISALEVIQVDGQVFVIAGGGDDGLTLMSMLPGGRLIHLQTIANDGENGLDNISSIEVARLGDALQVFVAASNTPGVMQFSVDIGNMGEVMRNFSQGSEVLNGTAGNDVMAGGGGNDTLMGGQGDDILISGFGDGQLQGGGGRDIFVIRPGVGDIHITDFDPAMDRLDLGQIPMLRSVNQLQISPTGSGMRIDFGDLRIIVNSHNGASLSVRDVFPDSLGSLDNLDRALFLNTPHDPSIPDPTDPPDTGTGPGGGGSDGSDGSGSTANPTPTAPQGKLLSGTQGADAFQGGAGNDTIKAWGGNDRAFLGDGNDIFQGGGGSDRSSGAGGNDRLFGGTGNDSLFGGDGNDHIEGHGDHDVLYGGEGDDVVEGWAGNDICGGAGGEDTLRGGGGNDRIFGGADNDLAGGGSGADKIWGGLGHDTIWGDEGNDTLGGASGDDQIHSGGGNDRVFAGSGNDRVWGDNGADTITGLSGNDRLFGGGGSDSIDGGDDNDRIEGGDGNDRLYGGTGNDTIEGGAGDDRMWGQQGADTFEFGMNHGHDSIHYYNSDEDLIRIEIGNTNYSQLEMRNVNGSAVIDTGPGTITLVGVRYQELDSDDFLFG